MELKPKILVLYTGGTIGMVKSESGTYVPFSLEGLLGCIPEINALGVDLHLESFKIPLDSALIGPGEWLEIVNVIKNNYDLVDGFVVLHGTDTMAYTSSALSFMLRGIHKPVVLTGAQVPIYESDSDGISNFINALKIARDGVVREVSLWFHETLFKGACVTKFDSKDFNGFSSPNHSHLAKKGSKIIYNKHAFLKGNIERNFFKKINSKVKFLNLLPSVNKQIEAKVIQENSIQGIVLSIFGSGTVPLVQNDPVFLALKNKKLPILAVTECYKGGLEIGKYEAGSVLNELGVISGQKMTKEAALTKLIVATSNFESTEKINSYLSKNQVGEL
ncbi:MAG: L-asparaginase 1 [Flavobacteriales bacterium]|nr:L-asparaginase 1 [Flavobacteriales bacterium]